MAIVTDEYIREHGMGLDFGATMRGWFVWGAQLCDQGSENALQLHDGMCTVGERFFPWSRLLRCCDCIVCNTNHQLSLLSGKLLLYLLLLHHHPIIVFFIAFLLS